VSVEWDEFIESLEGGDRQWVNSVNRKALARLKGDERERAIQLLMSRLNLGSPRISRAFGVLSDPRVRTALEAHLSAATGADKVATASALLELSPGHAAAIKAVKEGLANPGLVVANEALNAAEIAGKPIVDALLATGVMHPRPHTRIGAIKTALFLTGVNPSTMSWDHRDEIVGLAKGDRDTRRQSFAKLCQLMGVDLTQYRGPRP
jgi:hypothetical protein